MADIDPMEKEAPFSLAVIDWLSAYPQWLKARTEVGLKPEDPGPLPNPPRQTIESAIGPLYDDGVRQLTRALDIDPQYRDAMAYMNLIVRENADLADTPAEYQRQIHEADDWIRKALEVKKAKAIAPAPRDFFR